MVNVIRTAANAKPDGGIGQAVSVSVLPSKTIPAGGVRVHLDGIREPIEELTCMLVPAGATVETALAYMPATVNPGIMTYGGEIWTDKPPWWRD